MAKKEIYPKAIIVSLQCVFEFVYNWTQREEDKDVIYVRGFDFIGVVGDEEQKDNLLEVVDNKMVCDYATDEIGVTLLFEHRYDYNKFKEMLPNHVCEARVATSDDKKHYEL